MSKNGRPIPAFSNHERFLSKIAVVNQCWEWQGRIGPHGYGSFQVQGKPYRAHRVAYSVFVNQLTPGLAIDHKCKNRKCVNPDHLREVEVSVNCNENSDGITANYIKRTHCKKGHEFTKENTRPLISKGKVSGRYCIECRKLINKKSWIRRKGLRAQNE